jgi:uncharacterized MAPEG superfamily protein
MDRVSPLRQFKTARSAFYDDPLGSRALGARLNGVEAFPFLAVAVLLAEFRDGPQHLIDELAVLFLIMRIAYVFTYLGNRPTLRSILWSIGFAINAAIFLHAGDPGIFAGVGHVHRSPDAAQRNSGTLATPVPDFAALHPGCARNFQTTQTHGGLTASLRAKRSNPLPQEGSWIASSLRSSQRRQDTNPRTGYLVYKQVTRSAAT